MFVDPSTATPLYAVSKDGTVIKAGVQDVNGNQITINGSTFTDTLGRTFPSTDLTYYDSSGTAQSIQVQYTSVPIQTSLCQYSSADYCAEYTGNFSVIS